MPITEKLIEPVGVAWLSVFTVSVAVPEPPDTDEGVKVAVSPAAKAVFSRFTTPLKPD
jgi:hypothetical protein